MEFRDTQEFRFKIIDTLRSWGKKLGLEGEELNIFVRYKFAEHNREEKLEEQRQWQEECKEKRRKHEDKVRQLQVEDEEKQRKHEERMRKLRAERQRRSRDNSEDCDSDKSYTIQEPHGNTILSLTKSRIEPRVLKNREPENQKLIDELNYDREESNKLISELRNNLAIKENELKEHRETAGKLESKLSNVETRLTDLEKFDIKHRLKIEETEVESMNLRMRIAEMDKLLAQKDEEKSSWLKITKDKDRKVTELMKSEAEKGELLEKLQRELKGKEIEMNRNLISTQNNIADLSKALTEMGESLEEWKRENKIKLNEVEVESMTWKMKSIEMDNLYASLIKIVRGKDVKLAEMKLNLIIAYQNVTGLNKTVADKDECLQKLQWKLKEIKDTLTQKVEENNELTLTIAHNKEDIKDLWRIIVEKEEKRTELTQRLNGNDTDMTVNVQRTSKMLGTIVEKPHEKWIKEVQFRKRETLVENMKKKKSSDPDMQDGVKVTEHTVVTVVTLTSEAKCVECKGNKEDNNGKIDCTTEFLEDSKPIEGDKENSENKDRKMGCTTELIADSTSKDEKKQLKKKPYSGATQQYDVGSAKYCCELLNKGGPYDLQRHSRANTELHRDTVRSRPTRINKTMTDKYSLDRFTAGPLRVMFLLIVGVLGRTVSRWGESGAFAGVFIDTRGTVRGQEGKFKGQGYYDTSGGIVIPTWEVPRRHDLEHISLYNGNQGRLLFRIGDKRNIPPPNTMAMIFFFQCYEMFGLCIDVYEYDDICYDDDVGCVNSDKC